MKNLASICALAGMTAGSAFAQTGASGLVSDANGDGKYTFEELSAGMPEVTEATFAEIDANADGMVDSAEMDAAESQGLLPVMGAEVLEDGTMSDSPSNRADPVE